MLTAHCQAQISACAPATGPSDERAAKVAMLNAVSAEVRARVSPETSGSMQYSNDSVRTEVSSVVSAKLKQASIIRRQFLTDDNGRNARICVEVSIREDAPPRR